MDASMQAAQQQIWNDIGMPVIVMGIIFTVAVAAFALVWHGLVIPFFRDLGRVFFPRGISESARRAAVGRRR